jgi:hypothetical protein
MGPISIIKTLITNYGNPDQLTDKQRFWFFPALNQLIRIPIQMIRW